MHHARKHFRAPKIRHSAFFYAAWIFPWLPLGLTLWYFIAPDSLARFQGLIFGDPLQISALTVTVDERSRELLPDQLVELHPGQALAVIGVHSNRWRNYDLELYSPDLDINLLLNGHRSLESLLGPDAFDDPREVRLEIRDRGRTVALFPIRAALESADFIDRGDQAADPTRKVHYYQKALDLDPGVPEVRDKLVAALLANGQKSRAAEIWEEDLAKAPDLAKLTSLLDLYRDLGDKPKQVETLNRLTQEARARDLSPERYLLELAEHFKQEGRLDQAAAMYEELRIGADPEGEKRYLTELVHLYQTSGRPEMELEIWRTLLNLADPEQIPGIWTEMLRLQESLGNEAGQVEAWTGLAESLDQTRARANAYKRLGYLQAKDGNLDEARKAYQAAAALDAEDANVFLNLARLAAQADDHPTYRQYLAEALSRNPEDWNLRLELARSYEEDGLLQEALAEYRRLAEMKPGDITYRQKIISLLEADGDSSVLIAEYENLLRRFPEDQVAAYNLGVLRFQARQWDQAIAAFEKAARLDPSDALTQGYLVAAYKEKGQTPAMLEAALRAWRLTPDQQEYRLLLIAHYENAADWVNLARAAREFISRNRADLEAWRLLARAQSQQQQVLEAAQSLVNVAELSREADDWQAAALALAELGFLGEAKKAFEKVLELRPDDRAASEALLELNILTIQELSGEQ